MAKNRNYRVSFKRKRDGKTDYQNRLAVLKSRQTRIVINRMLNSFSIQFTNYQPQGDKTLLNANTRELRKDFGWKGHGGNLSTAYLVGYLAGLKAKKQKINEAVFNLGLYRNVKKSSLYSALKGVLDAGVIVPHSTEVLPSEEKVDGKTTVDYAKRLKTENKAEYEKRFGGYKKRGVEVENLQSHFNEIKIKIKTKWH